ncbi:MAG TPA: hypothetical protein VMH04_18525 [Candidatus Solibacter sp.]|nr:hypothetical protein [Candidatus Solibacter sp.]
MRKAICKYIAFAICATAISAAQTLRPPTGAVAGTASSISTSGSGSATFYLVGPANNSKRQIQLGEAINLPANELQTSGRYIAVVCADTCQSAEFFVAPANPASLTFLVHPSRAPVGENDVISGVALPFDQFKNLVVSPVNVNFQLASEGKSTANHAAATREGIAWFRTGSGRSAGAVTISASVNDVSARRVVQQVASDPCRLRIKGELSTKGIVVETEPVKDCAGNPVPDGTIVTFTAKDGKDTDTVDAPIKKGIARAQMIAAGPVVISAASGVVMGNELRLGGEQRGEQK